MNRFLRLWAARKPFWYIVGDSHIDGFRRARKQRLITRPSAFALVHGATAVGLRNPNSATNAVAVFRQALLPKIRNATPVIHLGEVDCGFVIWYRAAKYGESIDQQFQQSIDAYLAFVDELRASGYQTVVMTGATVPTLVDGQHWGEVANARREVTATLQERTCLTLRYNEALRQAARRRALPFIDLADAVLDPATGLVVPSFRHPDPKNHHLDPDKVAPLWAAALNRLAP